MFGRAVPVSPPFRRVPTSLFHSGPVLFALALLWTLLLGPIVATPAVAQSQDSGSGLEGKELTRVSDASNVGANIIGDLFGSPDGEIESVTVVRDRGPRLDLEVTFSGFDEKAYLGAEVQHGQADEREALRAIGSEVVAIDGSGTVSVVLELDPDSGIDDEVRSSFLLLAVDDSERGARRRLGSRNLFVMEKTWRPEVAAENRVVSVDADLMANPPYPLSEIPETSAGVERAFDSAFLHGSLRL